MRYLSVCSGIEAATSAWHPLGWEPVAFSEIEAFPSSLLAHHYPNVPNLGDMTKFQEWKLNEPIDLLVGGTPCQSFSVSGLRKGLADPRGNLMLTYLAIARKFSPRWLVWENVPGVLSSNGGRDFGTFLAGLGELGYGFAYRVLDAQYVRVESHPRAVPQRRRRVFVVGCLGDWRRAAAVLFERESLRGHPPPRRQAGQKAAPSLADRAKGGGGLGTDFECDGGLLPVTVGALTDGAYMGGGLTAKTHTAVGYSQLPETAGCLQERDAKGADSDTKPGHLIPVQTGGGFDVAQFTVEAAGTLGVGANQTTGFQYEVVSFDTTQITSANNFSNPKVGDPCHPLAAGAHPPAVAIGLSEELTAHENLGATLQRGGQGGRHDGVMTPAMQVRRLTPIECERLQGFPDNYTNVLYRGKPAADGPRYKALGNSMAVNVMRHIGNRIAVIDAIGVKEAA